MRYINPRPLPLPMSKSQPHARPHPTQVNNDELILQELNFILVRALSFVSVEKHVHCSHESKRSIRNPIVAPFVRLSSPLE